jgi:two-component system chemotaxis sensor kinase CheA
MNLDLTKYRSVFIEEATEHLSEMSSALLELEKEITNAAAIDLIFRMAHGIKGMAASLEYASITEVSHRLEDRMATIRDAGAASPGDEMALLIRGLETLEAMVGVVRTTGEAPPADSPMTVAFLEANEALAAQAAGEAPKKKALIP